MRCTPISNMILGIMEDIDIIISHELLSQDIDKDLS